MTPEIYNAMSQAEHYFRTLLRQASPRLLREEVANLPRWAPPVLTVRIIIALTVGTDIADRARSWGGEQAREFLLTAAGTYPDAVVRDIIRAARRELAAQLDAANFRLN